MVEPLKFPENALEPEIDESWAVCGTVETRKNLVTSIFLDFKELERFNYDLQEKYKIIKENEQDFEGYMLEDAEIILVSYGISSRISRTAVESARKEGLKVGLFRPKTLFPFPEKKLNQLAKKDCTFISVEMSNGQMADDIRLATCCRRPVEVINRLGGNLIEVEQILNKIRNIARGN
jgi:2-oxoisovalerate ferredoxin oxidoreductase alpha subunit